MNRIILKKWIIEYSISVYKILDYQSFPFKYKENISLCASLYLKILTSL